VYVFVNLSKRKRMATTSSIKLLQTIEWAKKFTFGRRAATGNFLEPALTNANIVLQTIVGAPFRWRWNRSVTGFVCTKGQQDYTLINWAASTQVSLGWMTVDSSGNSQKATTGGTTGTTLPAFNGTLNGTVTDGSVVWTNLGTIGTPVNTTYALSYVETASVQDISLSLVAPKWFELEPKLSLAMDSAQARPRNVSAQLDDGLGNVTFRLMPVPDQAYPIALTLQNNPPLRTSIEQTWSPIPDEYSQLFNWGFLSLMWLFADDPRFQLANQKFVSSILGASEGLSQTEVNIFLNQWQAITGAPVMNANKLQQGVQAQGV
jgi:hypothetical protein